MRIFTSSAALAGVALLLVAGVCSAVSPERLFATPHFQTLRLSHDGQRAAWFDPAPGDRWQLRVGRIGAQGARSVLKIDETPDELHWLDDRRLLLGARSVNHGRSILLADLEVGSVRRLVGAAGAGREGPRLVSLATAAESVILVSNDDRQPWAPDLYRVNVNSGVVTRQEKNSGGIFRWFSDGEGLVRLASRWRPNEEGLDYELLFRQRSYDRWSVRHRYALGQPPMTPLGFHQGGDQVLVTAVSGADTAALHVFDPHQRRLGEMLFGTPQADVESVVYAGGSGAPAMVKFEDVRPQRAVLDADWRRHLALLEARVGDVEFRVLQTSSDGRYALVLAFDDRQPGRYLRFDTARAEVVEIGRRLPRLDTRTLRPTVPVQFKAQDGLTLNGYVTLPSGDAPHPLVVLVHGGPWSRDRWGYSPVVQHLAGEGLAVMQVNFRGSRGLGQKLLQAGRRQWGEAMQSDLADGVAALAATGQIDSNRVCVMGASYGGYAALMSLATHSDQFRCAAAFAPVTDLGAQMAAYKERGNDRGYAEWKFMVGDPDDSAVRQSSPLYRVADIGAPVLIAHGAKDATVDPEQSMAMRTRLEQSGRQVALMMLPEASHELRRASDRIKVYDRFAKFINQHIGSEDS